MKIGGLILTSKYRNRRVVVDGYWFDSQAESRRYLVLKSLADDGKITHLQLQKPFRLHVNGILIGKYIPDFVYINHEGKTVVEDVKGVETHLFKWKRKHFEAQYSPLKIEIIK